MQNEPQQPAEGTEIPDAATRKSWVVPSVTIHDIAAVTEASDRAFYDGAFGSS